MNASKVNANGNFYLYACIQSAKYLYLTILVIVNWFCLSFNRNRLLSFVLDTIWFDFCWRRLHTSEPIACLSQIKKKRPTTRYKQSGERKSEGQENRKAKLKKGEKKTQNEKTKPHQHVNYTTDVNHILL